MFSMNQISFTVELLQHVQFTVFRGSGTSYGIKYISIACIMKENMVLKVNLCTDCDRKSYIINGTIESHYSMA